MCYVQLRRLEYIHLHNYIHRDLKPSNIVMGVGNQTNLVYLIDSGLSKEYQEPSTHLHIPFDKGLGSVGMTTFASIHSHMGMELGRRDDLESLA
jgi:serine/threonine protein kinase